VKTAASIGQDRPRLAVVSACVLTSPGDPYLDLRALATYSSLSVRKLRDLLDDAHPIPSYRVGGKILVRRGEFDAWMAARRHGVAVDRLVNDVLRSL